VLGLDDRAGGGIDLARQLEAVHVVVHGVEKPETALEARQARQLPPHEYAPLAGPGAVEVGLGRRGDRAGSEDRAAGLAVGEAGLGQVDPPGHVELPALPGAGPRPLRLRARQSGRLTGQPRDLDGRVHRQRRAGAAARGLSDSAREPGHHPDSGQGRHAQHDVGADIAGQNPTGGIPDLIGRRGQGEDLELHGAVVVGDPDRVGQGLGLEVVGPRLHPALVRVTSGQETRLQLACAHC
jgi:hypothetical protein